MALSVTALHCWLFTLFVRLAFLKLCLHFIVFHYILLFHHVPFQCVCLWLVYYENKRDGGTFHCSEFSIQLFHSLLVQLYILPYLFLLVKNVWLIYSKLVIVNFHTFVLTICYNCVNCSIQFDWIIQIVTQYINRNVWLSLMLFVWLAVCLSSLCTYFFCCIQVCLAKEILISMILHDYIKAVYRISHSRCRERTVAKISLGVECCRFNKQQYRNVLWGV